MRYVLILLAHLVFTNAEAEKVLFVSQLDIELDATQKLPLANKIRFELESPKAEAIAKNLAQWKNIDVAPAGDSALTVAIYSRPQFSGKLRSEYSTKSFVVDLEEESTKQFVSGFMREANHPLELLTLSAYVHNYVEHPTYIHGFNIASVAAKHSSGDCTEYAVLATALARSLELPARIVIGSVILEEKTQVTAFGHAWTEVWSNDQWHILDSALYNSQAVQLFYLPGAELDNEGPGFAMALIKSVGLLPIRISHLRNSE